MKEHWQQEHQRMMAEMAWLVGADYPTSSAIQAGRKRTLERLANDPVELKRFEEEFERMNQLNDLYCANAERES